MKPELISEILDRGNDDWLDFSEVLSLVRSQTGMTDAAAIAMSVDLIGEMLNRHLVVAGELQQQGGAMCFLPWMGQPSQIVERIQNELAGLAHRPGLGDICWLSTV